MNGSARSSICRNSSISSKKTESIFLKICIKTTLESRYGSGDPSNLSEVIEEKVIGFLDDYGIQDLINYGTDKNIFFKKFIDAKKLREMTEKLEKLKSEYNKVDQLVLSN